MPPLSWPHFENRRSYSTGIRQKGSGTSSNLVLWGTNLSSTVGERFTRSQLSMVKLPLHIQSIMVGLILSDDWITFDSTRSKNALLGFKQSVSNSSYLWFVFNLLSHYCSSYPSLVIGVRQGVRYYGLQFKTRAMPCITELRNLFYPELSKTKAIPVNIYDLLTPAALAHLIMGDGSIQRSGLIICTDSYTEQDVVRLMNVLIIKYRLDCTLRYHTPTQPRIYIKQHSMPLLRSIIANHFHFSMEYKLK